jgi:hypothetical protein
MPGGGGRVRPRAGRAVALNVAGWLGDPLPGQQALGLSADRLSGMFLVMAFGAAVPVSVAFASWAAKPGLAATRMLASGYALARCSAGRR